MSGFTASKHPRRGLVSWVANWWRARHQFCKLVAWLVGPGLLLLGLMTGLYIATGFVIGWTAAYDVALGVEAPDTTCHPAVAWPLSIAGWILVPAVIGTIAANVVTSSYDSYRKRSAEEIIQIPPT